MSDLPLRELERAVKLAPKDELARFKLRSAYLKFGMLKKIRLRLGDVVRVREYEVDVIEEDLGKMKLVLAKRYNKSRGWTGRIVDVRSLKDTPSPYIVMHEKKCEKGFYQREDLELIRPAEPDWETNWKHPTRPPTYKGGLIAVTILNEPLYYT